MGSAGRLRRNRHDDPAGLALTADEALCGEASEHFREGLVADPEVSAQDGTDDGLRLCAQEIEDASTEWVIVDATLAGDEAGSRTVDDELEAKGWRSSGSAMLDLELEGCIRGEAAQIEVRIPEGVEIGGAAQGGAKGESGRRLARVVDEQDGGAGGASESAEAVEDDGHL